MIGLDRIRLKRTSRVLACSSPRSARHTPCNLQKQQRPMHHVFDQPYIQKGAFCSRVRAIMDAFEFNINLVPRHQLGLCLSRSEDRKHGGIVARSVMGVLHVCISLADQWRALLYRSKIEHSPGDSQMSQKRESRGVVVILLIGYQYERALFFSFYCYCCPLNHVWDQSISLCGWPSETVLRRGNQRRVSPHLGTTIAGVWATNDVCVC